MSTLVQQLPQGWTHARLAEACEVILGQSPPGNTYNADGIGLPFFQGKAEFGDYYPTPVKWCSAPTKIAEPEDVLISVRAPVGPTNLCPSRACIGRGLAAIRPRQGIPSRYLLYALRATVGTLAEKATGSTFEAINGSNLRAHIIPVAPLDEQRRIVAEIEKQFTRLEAGVAALKRVQANLKRYRAAVLKVACEGDLLPTDTSIWKRLTLPQFSARSANSIRRGPFGSAIKKEFFVPDGYKVYEQQNAIYNDCSLGSYYIAEEKFRELSSFEVKPNDLVVSCSGTVGRIAIVPTWAKPGIINQALLKLTLDQDIVLNAFFMVMFRHRVREVLIAGARGAAMQNIAGVSELKKFEWPVPPIAEQSRIAAEVERRLSVVEELEAVVSANLQRATRLRQSILERAFTGELVTQSTSTDCQVS